MSCVEEKRDVEEKKNGHNFFPKKMTKLNEQPKATNSVEV